MKAQMECKERSEAGVNPPASERDAAGRCAFITLSGATKIVPGVFRKLVHRLHYDLRFLHSRITIFATRKTHALREARP
jgi:hypothetical protein